MPKPRSSSGEKNLISKNLIELRKANNLSQRELSYRLQLEGYDMDKNVITRIETNQRYVTDIELVAFSKVFQVPFDYLIRELDNWIWKNKKAVVSNNHITSKACGTVFEFAYEIIKYLIDQETADKVYKEIYYKN